LQGLHLDGKGAGCSVVGWQGRMREAERYLSRALEEARLGFGERDVHVASACNNLVGAGPSPERAATLSLSSCLLRLQQNSAPTACSLCSRTFVFAKLLARQPQRALHGFARDKSPTQGPLSPPGTPPSLNALPSRNPHESKRFKQVSHKNNFDLLTHPSMQAGAVPHPGDTPRQSPCTPPLVSSSRNRRHRLRHTPSPGIPRAGRPGSGAGPGAGTPLGGPRGWGHRRGPRSRTPGQRRGGGGGAPGPRGAHCGGGLCSAQPGGGCTSGRAAPEKRGLPTQEALDVSPSPGPPPTWLMGKFGLTDNLYSQKHRADGLYRLTPPCAQV